MKNSIPKKYKMRLHPEPFENIKSGKKKTEIRINDTKRKKIKVGDVITFSKRPKLMEKIIVKVTGRKDYADHPTQIPYYSKEEQEKEGVVIFNILLDNSK